ncbi:MAG: phospholipase D family protein, partial [Xanthomonadales bacterium]|nr:phospholipase D family protein [Xanthomonadales bacterium]
MNRYSSPLRMAGLLLICALLGACSTLPPGHDYPRTVSHALADPQHTTLGGVLETEALGHPGKSGFRLLSFGVDAYLTRMQMINAAEQTLDLQYSIFRGDDTGRLLTNAALQAADRGVRVRILMDDGERVSGDDQISSLTAHRLIEIRFYNPFAYRGSSLVLRGIEYVFNRSRLDYRMHNKLMVVDNAVALVGGRNIGDQYFQIDSEEQYADNDVFVVGPIVKRLSVSFDEFWNHPLSIPKEALSAGKSSRGALFERRELAIEDPVEVESDGIDLVGRVNSGEPFSGMISGRLPLVWAPAQVVSDSPDKKSVSDGSRVGRLMQRPVANATLASTSELLMITPYLIPGDEGLEIFRALRQRDVRIRILTNSLTSSTIVLAHSGYMSYRIPLLEDGVELFEIRAELGNTRGSGQTAAMARHGTYSLHAKVFVFDRQRIFVGSMNFDQRSMHLNTEIGLLIDSPELARELVRRFEAMTQPANAYELLLQPRPSGKGQQIIWRTLEDERMVDLRKEPSRGAGQMFLVRFLSLLPL